MLCIIFSDSQLQDAQNQLKASSCVKQKLEDEIKQNESLQQKAQLEKTLVFGPNTSFWQKLLFFSNSGKGS